MSIQTPQSSAAFQVALLTPLLQTGFRQLAAGSIVRAYCDAVADQLAQKEARQFQNLGETLLPFALGQNLDFLGEQYGVYRLGAQVAEAPSSDQNLRFYVVRGTFGDINQGQDILIPAGVTIGSADAHGPIYVTEAVTLSAGDSSAFVTATCLTPGAAGNAATGTCTRHNFTGYAQAAFGSLLVTNDYGIVGGRDAESDDNYRARIAIELQSRQIANGDKIRGALLTVPGVQDVVLDRQAGTFWCYVYSVIPQPAASLLQTVQQVLNPLVYPLTGTAIAPDLVGISFATTITVKNSVSSADQSLLVASAQAAAADYINNLAIGDPLVINQIATRIFNADPRILDVGAANQEIAEILIWRSRQDGTRFSRYLLGNYTPQTGERIVTEISATLPNPIQLTVVTG